VSTEQTNLVPASKSEPERNQRPGVLRRIGRSLLHSREASIAIAGIILVIYFQSTAPVFLSPSNISNLAVFAATTAIIAAGDPSRAAIASRRAAEIHGGKILREHLEDNPENYTRFLLLGPSSKTSDSANKLSLVFQTAHRPGALFHALGPFARRGINLMKIESRPIAGRPWEYRFYLDLQASALDPEVAAAIAELEKLSVNLRILGSYVSAEIFSAKAN